MLLNFYIVKLQDVRFLFGGAKYFGCFSRLLPVEKVFPNNGIHCEIKSPIHLQPPSLPLSLILV